MSRSAAALALLVCACGSKSGLLAQGGGAGPAGSGGAGAGGASGGAAGTVASGGGGSGGAGAAGGAPSLCAALELEGVARITGAPKHDELDPALVASSDDGTAATLMFRWHTYQTEPGFTLNDKLGHLSFSAWGPWPEDLGQAWVAKTYGSGSSFALADAPAESHAFLYWDDGSLIGPEGMYFVPAMVPKGNAPSVALGVAGQRALFAERGAAGHLLGFERSTGPGHFGFTFMRFGGNAGAAHDGSGCAIAPISAAAAHLGQGYLLVLSSSRPYGTCLNDDGIDGPPARIQVVRWADAEGQPALVAELEMGAPVKQLELVVSEAARWLVYQYGLPTSTQPILARQLDAAGQALPGEKTLVTAAPVDGSFAAAPFGDGFAVAWDFGGTPGQAQIDVFGPDASWHAGLGLGLESPSPHSLLGAPDGQKLLLAWSAFAPEVKEKRVRVARFRCQ